MDPRKLRIESQVVHAGRTRPLIEGAAVLPVFQCTVYEHLGDVGEYHDVVYPRLNNAPNHAALACKLAALESGEDALVTASGMSAISTVLLEVLGQAGHLLVQDQLYGGTHAFVTQDLGRLGHGYDFVPRDDPDAWKAALKPNTRAIYVETLTNPLLRVADHRSVVAFAREHGLVSIVDNTFATPVNFRPIEVGFDVVVHSGTKYLNGHNDLVAGAIVGSRERIEACRHLLGHLGGSLDPHACYLLDRGLKTLVLRVRQQNAGALALARRLSDHDAVKAVSYPGLAEHPDHERASELFEGYGGMLAFEPAGGVQAARRFFDRVQLPMRGPSLGGVDTLVTRPVTTSHASLTAEEREALGIREELIRVSVGIEAAEDLIADFATALA